MSEDVKLKPHEAAFTAIAKHVTVTPQDGRFLITVGHGLVDDPIYELYNTEQSANHAARDLVSVLSVVIGDVMTQREQDAEERGRAAERARITKALNVPKQTAAVCATYARTDLRLRDASRYEAQVEAYDNAINIVNQE